jgi:hypothetical protein
MLTTGCPVEPDPPAETEGEPTGSSTTSMTSTADDATATSSSDGSTTSSTTEASDSSGSTTETGSSGSTTGTDSSGSTTGTPPSFDCPPGEGEQQCDLALQDCPEGWKCILWDAEGDLLEPDATVCAPLDDHPVELYGNCTNDIAACTDDCPSGAACLPFYDEGGTCLDMCGEDDSCPGDQVCFTCASCWNAWCIPTCDPLAPDCPDTLGSCAPDHIFGQSAFSCAGPPPGPGGSGDPCDTVGSCAEGLLCTSQETLGPECFGPGCCTELCDLLDPGASCSNPAHVCIPVFIPGQALPSQEHIGMCALPEAHPCNTPGLCPPPGIDDTYPWCSPDNENFCPRGIFGFNGGAACTQGCSCIETCAVDAECPVPATGNAVPVCLDWGPGFENDRCILPCGGGEVCPDGMVCAPEWGDVCMWVSPLPPDEC